MMSGPGGPGGVGGGGGVGSTGHHDDLIVTPFAQILASLRTVRANLYALSSAIPAAVADRSDDSSATEAAPDSSR